MRHFVLATIAMTGRADQGLEATTDIVSPGFVRVMNLKSFGTGASVLARPPNRWKAAVQKVGTSAKAIAAELKRR